MLHSLQFEGIEDYIRRHNLHVGDLFAVGNGTLRRAWMLPLFPPGSHANIGLTGHCGGASRAGNFCLEDVIGSPHSGMVLRVTLDVDQSFEHLLSSG